MTEHVPECELLEPCSADIPEHGFCSRQQTYCIHCERACICERLRAVEKRALIAARETVAGFLDIDSETGDRRCTDATCGLCVVAPLIYAALEDLSKGGQR